MLNPTLSRHYVPPRVWAGVPAEYFRTRTSARTITRVTRQLLIDMWTKLSTEASSGLMRFSRLDRLTAMLRSQPTAVPVRPLPPSAYPPARPSARGGASLRSVSRA